MKFKLYAFYSAFVLLPVLCFSQIQIGNGITGEAEDNFLGRRRTISLSADGNIIALGAPDNYANGTYSGHVRVFENINNEWIQLGEDIDGLQAFTGLGYSTSLSDDGTILAIGAGNSQFYPLGIVSVYQNVNATWQQIGDDIFGEDAIGDHFGGTISLSSNGNILAVGDFKNSQNGSNSGHVRVFENSNDTWIQIGNDIDGFEENEEFGRSVSLSADGTFVAIGAPGNNSGLVRVFENINGSWTQEGNDIIGEAIGDSSGFDVSLSSDGMTVAIGAHENDGNGINSGHVRIFENIAGVWTQIGNDIDGEASIDFSGFSLSLSANGNIVAIGAYANDANGSSSGHVRIFQNNNGSWNQIGNDIDGENLGDLLGRDVAISDDGSTVACGAWASDANGNSSGQVLIYDISELLSNLEFELHDRIRLFPNPTNNILHIKANHVITSIQVYNLLGQPIFKIAQNSLFDKIDMSELNLGVYLVEVEMEGRKATYKVIKE